MSDIVYTYENLMPDKTSVAVDDFIRLVGYDNASYKALISNLAKCLVESYAGSSLAGADQTIQNAINEINNKVNLASGGLAIATTASSMIDHDTIYVYTGSETGYEYGNWYYWDGESFTSGGEIGGLTPDKTLSQDGVAADAKVTGDSLKTKAESDGMVSMAKALVGGKYTLDQSPYHYRQSPDAGSLDEKIVGGTLGWNQLVENGNFADASGWSSTRGTQTIANNELSYAVTELGGGGLQNRTVRSIFIPMNHMVLVSAEYYAEKSFDFRVGLGGTQLREFNISNGVTPNIWNKLASIVVNDLADAVDIRLGSRSGVGGMEVGDVYKFRNVQCIDLTTLFGSTIADYIYSLEQSSAGAGVDWVRQYIDLDTYHEYCEPMLKSVEGLVSRDVVGFNQWDEEWEVGGYNFDGKKTTTTNELRCKNAIPVLSEQTYYFKTPIWGVIYQYDSDEKLISRTPLIGGRSTPYITATSNCKFFRFFINNAYGTTYNHDICINLSDPSRNGTYESYEKHSYPLDSTLELRGIPKLSDGKMYFDGDEYSSDGQVKRRYSIKTFVGASDESWSLQSINDAGIANFQHNNALPNRVDSKVNPLINNRFDLQSSIISETTTEGLFSNSTNTLFIRINSSKANTVDAFKSWLSSNPLTIVYELANPTTETAQPYQSPQLVGSTEEYVTTGVVPVGHESRYYEDITGKVNDLPSDFSTLIAPVEKSFTATRNYTVGSFVIVNNQLYKVTSAISSGRTITPNSNVTATTIMAEILALA